MADGRSRVHAAVLGAMKPSPTLAEMIDDAEAEAARIETVQAGLIDTGGRREPDAGQVRRVAVLDRLVRFLRLVGRYEPEVRSLLEQLQQRDRSAT